MSTAEDFETVRKLLDAVGCDPSYAPDIKPGLAALKRIENRLVIVEIDRDTANDTLSSHNNGKCEEMAEELEALRADRQALAERVKRACRRVFLCSCEGACDHDVAQRLVNELPLEPLLEVPK